jgi:hypothetical protein
MLHHVFLSYSRKDTAFMKRIKMDLLRAGLAVWTDENLDPGTPSWQQAIENALKNSGCIMCILSPDSAKSQWVREELHFARIHNIEQILLLARGEERDSIPFGYTSVQWIDIRNRELYLQNMKQVMKQLQKRFENLPLSQVDSAISMSNPNLVNQYDKPPILSEFLPQPFDWCEVLAGHVIVDDVSYDVERFFIAKYPITNQQFDIFAGAEDGYANAEWWEFSEEASRWYLQNPAPEKPSYRDQDIPRTEVNWFEAVAYCRWLTAVTNNIFVFQLPTEWQWQRAAQGDDGRLYPWGNEYAKNRCNTLKSAIGRPTKVTDYPGGVSPFGVFDMCGNVSEWCLSDFERYSTQLEGEQQRVIRGGAYDSGRTFAQVIIRNYAAPDTILEKIGFRIVAMIPQS